MERNETVTKTIQLQLSAPNSLLTDNSKRNAVHLIRHIEILSGQMNAHFLYFIRIAKIFKEEILVFIEILKISVF